MARLDNNKIKNLIIFLNSVTNFIFMSSTAKIMLGRISFMLLFQIYMRYLNL